LGNNFLFKDRYSAGALLAQKLSFYKKKESVLVVGVPRGGVPVAKAISEELLLPLQVVITRKIGAPDQKELAIGAVSQGGVVILDRELIKQMGVDEDYIKRVIDEERNEVKERITKFQATAKSKIQGKTVILVDDGIATGATTEAAIGYLRSQKVVKIILATPVASREAAERLKSLVDEMVVLEIPSNFQAVGQFYNNFPQVTDEEVTGLF
jgi:putative phosphoribosyl transferase